MNKNKPFGIDGNTKFKNLDVAEVRDNWAILNKAPAPEKLFHRYLAGVEDEITPDAKVEMVLAGSNAAYKDVSDFMVKHYGQPEYHNGVYSWQNDLPEGIELIILWRDQNDDLLGRQVIGMLFGA